MYCLKSLQFRGWMEIRMKNDVNPAADSTNVGEMSRIHLIRTV